MVRHHPGGVRPPAGPNFVRALRLLVLAAVSYLVLVAVLGIDPWEWAVGMSLIVTHLLIDRTLDL